MTEFRRVYPIKPFLDDRGVSYHDFFWPARERSYLHNKALLQYQINYSTVNPGIIKAWHRHKMQDDYFFVLKGNAKVGIINLEGKPESYCIGENNPAVIHIRAGEWHGLTPIGNEPCGLMYYVTNRYDPSSPDEERAGYKEFVPEDWWLPKNE